MTTELTDGFLDDIKPGDWLVTPMGERILVISVCSDIKVVSNKYTWKYMRAERGFWRALIAWPFTRRKFAVARPFVVRDGMSWRVDRDAGPGQ